MITGPLDIFYLAGRLWNHIFGQDQTPYFAVEIVNSDSQPIQCDAIPWLLKHYHNGTHVAAMCTGTFFLAETGLLDYKSATTHWGFVDDFRKLYPRINLIPERLITDEGDVYCCGASNACFDIALYLVQKMVGREIALQTAKVFICDMDRIYQSEWAVFRFQKSHKDEMVLKAQAIMEKAYATINTIEDLCDQIGIGRRSLERRFKAATGDTPLKYLHRLRVEAAKRIIETKSCSFDEIAYQVGYENSGFFRKVFTDLCHISPKTYRTKWGKVNFPDSHFQVQAAN